MKIDLWEIFWGILKNILLILWEFWPFWVTLLTLGIILLLFERLDLEINDWRIRRKFKKGEGWRSDRELIQWLRGMNPTEFEVYIADLFRRLGYRTEQIGGSHDGGVDVIAEKNGVKHYIQCKKYFSKHEVGSPEIRDFYGAIVNQLSNGEGWFITTNKFTPEAEKFAEDKPIVLINQFKLAEYVRLAQKQGVGNELRKEKTNQKCPKCDGVLVERSGKFGSFYGCVNYPKCDYTANKR